MGIPVDLGGEDLYCNSIYTGVAQGQVTGNFLTSPGLVGVGEEQRKFVIKSVNFNAANSDNAIAITLPAGVSRYSVLSVILSNASASISTATVAGLFTAAAGGGTNLVTGGAITVTATTANSANSSQSFAGVSTVDSNSTTLFFRVGTAQGSAATADVVILINVLT